MLERAGSGRGRRGWRRLAAAALLGLAALGLTARSAPAQSPPGANALDDFEREILSLARRSEPFVVNIVAQLAVPPPNAKGPGHPVVSSPGPQRRIGTGIAIDDQGSVITTASVVDGAVSITVRTASGASFAARLVGLDRRTNVALLSAPGAVTAAAPRGESSLVMPGSRVLVMGSVPYQRAMSSFGTVEVDRGLVLGYSEVEMLQVNAPVVRGNSGAAVLNSDGRVVGMVSGTLDDAGLRKRPPAGRSISGYIYGNRIIPTPGRDVTFAVPIEKVLEIAAELRERGHVDRGFLGVVVQRGEGGTADLKGVLVSEVMPGGPAAQAGIRSGDLIVQYAGRDVEIGDQLTFLVSATRPGSHVELIFLHDGRPQQAEAVVGLAPNTYPSTAGFPTGLLNTYPGTSWGPVVRPAQPPGTPLPGGARDDGLARRP
jgi:serine protease Do